MNKNLRQVFHFEKITLFLLIILINTGFAKTYNANQFLNEGDSIKIEFPIDKKIDGNYTLGQGGALHINIGGVILLDGLEVSKARDKIKKFVRRYYKSANSLKLYVIKKTKRICITGQVVQPGYFSLEKDSDIQMLVQKAGGFIDGAKIDEFIVRNKYDSKIRTVNYQQWIEKSGTKNEINLNNGDCVFVPRSASMGKIHRHLLGYTPPPDESRRNIINVLGEVAKPGAYEINQKVNVLDMIAMAGGPLIPRNSNIIYDIENIQIIKASGAVYTFNMNKYFKEGDEKLLLEVDAGDNILLPNKKVDVEDRAKVVSVLGAVKNPSSYEISKTIPLYQLIARAGGFLNDSIATLSKTDSITVLRFKNDRFVEKLIYSFEQIINGKYPTQPLLYPDDILFVPFMSANELANQKSKETVQIIGEVHLPGVYNLADENTLSNMIAQAGGPKLETSSGVVTIIRYIEGKRTRITFNYEGYIHVANSRNYCFSSDCLDRQPVLKNGDLIVIERRSALFFKEWLDLVWKSATVGLFIYTVMK